MPPTFDLRDEDDDDDHDYLRAGVSGDGVRVLRSVSAPAPTLTPQAFRLPPLRRRPAASRSTPAMLLRRPRRWLQLCAGVIMGLAIGLLVGTATRMPDIGRQCFPPDGAVPAPGSGPAAAAAQSAGSGFGFGFGYGPGSERWTSPPSPPGYGDDHDPLHLLEPDSKPGGRRSLVMVGVMTADKYLPTRAAAVWDTWGKELPGGIAFFSASYSRPPPNRPDLPLVALKGVDDSYPPQKKSFRMIEYLWEQYGDHFEWFLRADDDVYVRPDKLEKLLRSVDSSKPQFIGQAGRGNQEEFGLLSLEFDENFCMGGPGVLFSRETLSRVAPHVKHCLKNLYTTHEDVELGRCVQRFAGIPCTWSYEMQNILYHNSSGNDAFTGNLKHREVHRAITLHPIKQYRHLYRVHNYLGQLKIQDSWQQALSLHRDIVAMLQLLGQDPALADDAQLAQNVPLFHAKRGDRDYLGDSALLGKPPGLNKSRPRREAEVLPWDFISRSLFSAGHANPRRRIESALREGMDDVVREVMDMINAFSKQRGRVIEYREILYGYHRLDPVYGADYILDLLLVYKKYRGKKMTVPVRRHAYLQQQFTGLEIRETVEGEEVGRQPPPDLTQSEDGDDAPPQPGSSFREAFESGLLRIGDALPSILGRDGRDEEARDEASVRRKMINFILPLAGRFSTFSRFISVFEEECLMNAEQVALFVILFPSEQEVSVNETVSLMSSLQRRWPQHRLAVVPVFDSFARALALEIGAAQVKDGEEDLLFFVDVDMVFNRATLERIRVNTIRGRQAYFPIVFSEFEPATVYRDQGLSVAPNHFLINQDTGYWRQYGFGIVSLYKSDLRRVGGFDTSIRGWGKEDVDLYDKFVASMAANNVSVFRAADPNLVHVFHIVDCDPNLEASQLKMCKGTRADTLGGVSQLAQGIYAQGRAILDFAKKRRAAVPAASAAGAGGTGS